MKKSNLVYQAFIIALMFFSVHATSATSATAQPSFTILQYHHVSSETPPVTSISPDKFAEHMAYLNENHTVISMDKALEAVKSDTPLPENAVVITFDDGFANIYENGSPLLKKYEFPFVIFVNPDQIGQSRSQLSWEQMEEMRPLATYANHTIGHIHLLNRRTGEGDAAWLERVMENIEQAERVLTEKIGYSKRWLAYPFGEFNHTLKDALLDAGFLGFAQHSGAVGRHTDFGAIPRFPAAGIYANISTLKVKLASLPMPVKSHAPSSTEQRLGETLEKIELELSPGHGINTSQIACYFKGKSLDLSRSENSIVASLEHRFTPGRMRVNCTAPANTSPQRFYWYSIPYFTANEEGYYPD